MIASRDCSSARRLYHQTHQPARTHGARPGRSAAHGEKPNRGDPELYDGRRRALDLTFSRVDVNGQTKSLTPNEFRLLAALMHKPGQVMTREALLQTVWQEPNGNLHLVEVHIANLRTKIEENPRRPKRLVTVRSSGYKFVDNNNNNHHVHS